MTAGTVHHHTADTAHRTDAKDSGQATVELALALPLLCTLMLGIVQLVVVVAERLRVGEAARIGARAAAVAVDPVGAGSRAAASAGIGGADITVTLNGGTVRVVVSVVDHTDVPLIGALLPDVRISAGAVMLLDPP